MKSKARKIGQWLRRQGVKIGWAAALVALIAVIILRLPGSREVVDIPVGLVDSLQRIESRELQCVDYRAFRIYYNAEWHLPACVTYELTPAESRGALPRATHWLTDSLVRGCAESSAYVHSGYDRGHMAPAGDMRWDSVAMQQSFTMTNVCPQNHHLNEGGWARLEEKVREWVVRDSGLIVITGPVVGAADTLTIGERGVRVPGAFYKIVLAHRVEPMRVAAFVYPNSPADGRLRDYATTVREIEQLTGIDFFQSLPQPGQDKLETTLNLNPWVH